MAFCRFCGKPEEECICSKSIDGREGNQTSASNSGAPAQTPVYPTQNNSTPVQTPVYPPQNNSTPVQTPVYPPQNNSTPAQTPVYPPQNNSTPTQTPVYPPQNNSTPAQTPVNPTQNDGTPTQTPVNPQLNYGTSDPKPKEKLIELPDSLKNKKLPSMKTVGIIAGAVVAVIVFLCFLPQMLKINPMKYMDISFKGIDGKGYVSYDFDKAAFVKKAMNKEYTYLEKAENDEIDSSTEKYWNYYNKIEDFIDNIDYDIEPTDGLSVGDKVTVTFTVTGTAKKKVKSVKKTFKVKKGDLKTVSKIDAFKDIEVKFSGISGEGELEIINNSENEFLQNVSYYADEKYDLKNGQEVVITCSYYESDVEEYALTPEQDTKTYTVSGLDEYLTDAGKITSENVKILYSSIVEEINEDASYNYSYQYGTPRYKTAFFRNRTSDDSSKCNNVLLVYVEVDRTDSFFGSDTIYYQAYVKDIVVKSDGSVYFDPDDIDGIDWYYDYDDIIEDYKDTTNFDTKELTITP